MGSNREWLSGDDGGEDDGRELEGEAAGKGGWDVSAGEET